MPLPGSPSCSSSLPSARSKGRRRPRFASPTTPVRSTRSGNPVRPTVGLGARRRAHGLAAAPSKTGRSDGRAHDRGPDIADRQAPCRATDALGRRERSLRSVLRTTESRCVPLHTCRETRARPVVGAPVAPMAGRAAAPAGRGGRDARAARAPEWRIVCENFHKLPAWIGLPPPAPRAPPETKGPEPFYGLPGPRQGDRHALQKRSGANHL